MPLPNLDDRRWADLVEEGRALIPVYAPAWTDHNVHDPGITLMELLAWIAEMDVYQLNQIPERHRRKFLALIGVRPKPPRPARTVLSFALSGTDQTDPLRLPATVEFEGKDPFDEATRFRTLEDVTVVRTELRAIQAKDQKGFQNLTDRWKRGEPVRLFGDDPQPGMAVYLGFSEGPPRTVPVSLLFTFSDLEAGTEEKRRLIHELESQRALCRTPDSLVICQETRPSLCHEVTPPSLTAIYPNQGPQGATVFVTLTGANFVSAATVNVSGAGITVSDVTVMNATSLMATFVIAEDAPLGHRNVAVTTPRGTSNAVKFTVLPPPPPLTHHSVHTVWEFLTEHYQWRRLHPVVGEVRDDTRAFTLNGRVLFNLPAPMGKQHFGQVACPLYYLRCRFVAGAYDAAPELKDLVVNGVAAEQAVPAGVLKWTIAKDAVVQGSASPGEVVGFRIQFNAYSEIRQLVFGDEGSPRFRILEYQAPTQQQTGVLKIEAELVSHGTGRPSQQVTLAERPVVEHTLAIFTIEDEEGDWYRWTLRQDFDASSRSDRHFVLDTTQGVLTFGNGERGRVVPLGAPIISSYLTTRAEAGNLAADKIKKLADSLHNQALLSALGGVKKIHDRLTGITNSIAATGGAAAETLEHAEGRAVELMERPNRAVTLADYEFFAKETPGVRLARVSARANLHPALPCVQAPGMIAVLVLPFLPAGRPMPSIGLQRMVGAYLARRRVIGTRVEVFGPTYLEVAVQAKVQAYPGTNLTGLRDRITAALGHFFHPLVGGPDGRGWPFGRDVYRAEVLQVIDETEGVDHVLSLELIAEGGEPQCGNVCLGPTGLVAAGQHQIDVM